MSKSFKIIFLLVAVAVISTSLYLGFNYLSLRNTELELKLADKVKEDAKKTDEESLLQIKVFTGHLARYPDSTGEFSTKWRNGSMDYILMLPMTEKLFNGYNNQYNKVNGHITVELYDKDGFRLEGIELDIKDIVGRIGDNDKLIEIGKKGSKEMSKEKYKQIESIRLISNIQ